MKSTIVLFCVGLLAGCSETVPSTTVGLTSYQVVLTTPAADMLGTPPAPPVTITDVVFDITAIDDQGQVWPNDVDVNVYVSFAGNKIGQFTECGNNEDSIPLATIHLTNGVDLGQKLHLIKAYGETTLWFQTAPPPGDGGVPTNFATGASAPIYFPNPTIPQVQTPFNLQSPTAFYCSPFNGKHVEIDHATSFVGPDPRLMVLTKCTAGAPQATTDKECQNTGDVCGTDLDQPATDKSSYCLSPQVGKLVVTSVFIDSYVVADTGAMFHGATGTGGFNHMFVYSFGEPDAAIIPGRVMSDFGGNISKFVGFSELNFPLQDYTDTTDVVPPPYVLSPDEEPANDTFSLRLLHLSGARVSITGKMCGIDQTQNEWIKYNQFGLDMSSDGATCSENIIEIALPSKTLGSFNPLKIPGALTLGNSGTRATITVIGMLQNSSGQNDETTPPTLCQVNTDCSPVGGGGVGGTCVEGSCKKGDYNFWTIRVGSDADITVPAPPP